MTFNEQLSGAENSGSPDDYANYAEWYSQAYFERPDSTERPEDLIVRINAEQDLNLNPILLENAERDCDFDFGYQCDTKSPINRVVAIAANLLYDNPHQRLADRQMEITTNHPDLTERLALDTLARIVNGSIKPETETQMSDYRFEDRNAPGVDACELAEKRFEEAFKQMDYPDLIIKGEIRLLGYRIITDDNNPIIVSKGRGTVSSISLVPTTINEITYPAGSLLNVEIWDDFKSGQDRQSAIRLPHKLDRERVIRARFIRLLDWAGDYNKLHKFKTTAQQVLPLVREPAMPNITMDMRDRILQDL